MIQPKDYTNHSGGALGADLAWDRIGRQFGVTNHIHYRPEHLKNMSPKVHAQMLEDVKLAAIALGRPMSFNGVELVHRNWFQVHHGEAIYAISTIILPGYVDSRGFTNKTQKAIVAGGTGWAVEMGIQKDKPVYVFDLEAELWHRWNPKMNRFIECQTPVLTQAFAGIGSRNITDAGTIAIREVYQKTFHEKTRDITGA